MSTPVSRRANEPPSTAAPEPDPEPDPGPAAGPVAGAGLAAGPAADAGRWPDVAAVPRCSRARAAVAGALVRRALSRLPLRCRLAGGEVLGTGGPLMEVADPEAFVRRIGTGGLIGFGESYMAGEWDAPDLVGVLTVFAEHVGTLIPGPLQRLRGLWARRQPTAQRNTPQGARDNVHRHYDLSNELFALFLDETLSYSSALFTELPAVPERLPAAQHRKIDRLLDLAGVGAGTRLLEVGTGWGELAIRAARRGAQVVSITLSEEQRSLATDRVRRAGLADRVTVSLCDYREATGSYDAIVSVEMIEAVGADYWPGYFAALEGLLAPGGRIAIQAITMPDDRMLASRRTFTWIQKYIFPGGLIPSAEAIERATAGHTGLRVADRAGFGAHYAETLRLWRERFTEREAEVGALGFDAVFRRMWTFYLAYSEAGFRAGYLDVQQLLLTAEPVPAGAGTGAQDGPRAGVEAGPPPPPRSPRQFRHKPRRELPGTSAPGAAGHPAHRPGRQTTPQPDRQTTPQEETRCSTEDAR